MLRNGNNFWRVAKDELGDISEPIFQIPLLLLHLLINIVMKTPLTRPIRKSKNRGIAKR